MNENEMIEFEGRQYVNPDISRDEQMAFINTMRDMQAQNNAQIATETHNLGTDVEPNRGGLSGSEDYWMSRYQTPQTNELVANMKAVAQQSALNNAMSNYSNMLQNRYNQAYRNYQKRAYRHNSGGGGGNGTDKTTTGGVDETAAEDSEKRTYYGIPGTTVKKEGDKWVWTDNETGATVGVSASDIDKYYNDDGSLTDEGYLYFNTMYNLHLGPFGG